MNNFIEIRALDRADIPFITGAFNSLGWSKPASLFEGYLKEQEAGDRLVWVAFVNRYGALREVIQNLTGSPQSHPLLRDDSLTFAGYITLKWHSSYKPFKEQKIPEIMDLNILPAFRKMGIGSELLNIAEEAALKRSEIVGIGVGLYAGSDGGYGPAQRLYIKRGYIPDGRGVTYNYQPTIPGNSYRLDDDLLLWFTKKLS